MHMQATATAALWFVGTFFAVTGIRMYRTMSRTVTSRGLPIGLGGFKSVSSSATGSGAASTFQQRRSQAPRGRSSPQAKGAPAAVVSSDTAGIDAEDKIVKRKFAMVCCYLGTNYKGIQYTTPEIPTIERELMRALYKTGCILESNFGDLSKIAWSRSSRTDKGVHCARVLITAKLEVNNLELARSTEGRLPELVSRLNEELPSDIRVMSIVRSSQGFTAQTHCHWREYEYFLPLASLLPEADGVDASEGATAAAAAIQQLNKSLKKYEGTNSFHNFHRLGAKTIIPTKKSSMRPWNTTVTDTVESNTDPVVEGLVEAEEAEEEDGDGSDGENGDDAAVAVGKGVKASDGPNEAAIARMMEQFDLKELAGIYNDLVEPSLEMPFVPRLMAPKTQNSIYYCEAQSEPVVIDGMPFVKIVIIGKSFLLHQIRLMVGAAVVESMGLVPSNSIELAMTCPMQITFPMAPAEGLVLVNAGIAAKKDEHRIFSRFSRGYFDEFPLLTDDEYKRSEEFKSTFVYPAVKRDWGKLMPKFMPHIPGMTSDEVQNRKVIERDMVTVLDYWKEKVLNTSVPSPVKLAWNQLYTRTSQICNDLETSRDAKELVRRLRLVEEFQREVLAPSAEVDKASSSKKSGGKKKPYPHKFFLPNHLCTDLLTTFRLTPDKAISVAMSALATKVVMGEIPANASSTDIVAYVEKNGGVKEIAKGLVHPMII